MNQLRATVLMLVGAFHTPMTFAGTAAPVAQESSASAAAAWVAAPDATSLSALRKQSDPVLAPAWQAMLAQMSRDEHERLRLELRQRVGPGGSVGPLDSLISPPFWRSGLTFQERQRLREQLRQQRQLQGLQASDGLEPDGRSLLRRSAEPALSDEAANLPVGNPTESTESPTGEQSTLYRKTDPRQTVVGVQGESLAGEPR